MSEPTYIRQSGDILTPAEKRAWLEGAVAEARTEGATWFRATEHPAIPNLLLLEGWTERPDSEGEQRWALTA